MLWSVRAIRRHYSHNIQSKPCRHHEVRPPVFSLSFSKAAACLVNSSNPKRPPETQNWISEVYQSGCLFPLIRPSIICGSDSRVHHCIRYVSKTDALILVADSHT